MSSLSLLCALSICEGALIGVLLEDLVEVVGVAEADLVSDLGHRLLGLEQELHRAVDAQAVYVLYGSFADGVLEHLGEIVGRDVDHIRKLLDVYLLAIVLGDIGNYGSKTENVVIDHTVGLVL